MDKIKIGIPRALHYYHYHLLWENTLKELGFEVVVSPPTNRAIISQGMQLAGDEMCLSLKIYLGHIKELEKKCDYILVPRIDNYGVSNQTCTNFLALPDIVCNLIETPILDYNVNLVKNETHQKGFIDIGHKFHIKRKDVITAYQKSIQKMKKKMDKNHKHNITKCQSSKIKVLVVGHSYNIQDYYIGTSLIDILKDQDVEIIYADQLNAEKTEPLANKLSRQLYWKYNKQLIGAVELLKESVDGIIFISSFPCGPDSLANELVIRKLTNPILNIIIDDLDGLAGMETRIESFIDILKERKICHTNP